jgi:hypothetical protein
MSTTRNRKKLMASALGAAVAAAATSGIAIPLAAMILAVPANAETNIAAFEPPDPCLTATSCQNVHVGVALNPQPLPPGRALNPRSLPPGRALNPQPLPPGYA